MKSDFKYIVKESLREAFYKETTEKPPTFKMVILGEVYYVVISTNNTPKQRPYKMTFFKREKDTGKLVKSPAPPWDIDWDEMEYMLKNKKLPDRLIQGYQKYKGKIEPPEIVSQGQPLNETLFFLENSARELELFIENRRTA